MSYWQENRFSDLCDIQARTASYISLDHLHYILSLSTIWQRIGVKREWMILIFEIKLA